MTVLLTAKEWKVFGRLVESGIHLLRGECASHVLVEKWAENTPDNTAVLFEDRKITYKEFNETANRVANHFRSLGGKEGDTVAVFMENCPEYLALIVGLNKIGMIASLINSHLRHKPLIHAIDICQARWVVAGQNLIDPLYDILGDTSVKKEQIWVWDGKAPEDSGANDMAEHLAKTSDSQPPNTKKPKWDDHVVNIYTSGTTGLPKAARVSNRRIFFSGYALGRALARYGPGDVLYVPLPLYHSAAIFVAWGGTLASGAGIGLRRRFSASDYWDEAKRFGATGAVFIGEMPRYLLAQPEDPKEKDHSIRRIITIGLRANIWEKFQERFGIEEIYEFYGATETSVGVMNVEGRPGYLGRLMPLQSYVVKWDPVTESLYRNEKGRCETVGVGEEGMMIGRINSIFNLLGFDGYVDDEATQQKLAKGVFHPWDEFFVTGDVVKVHEDNWVSFMDRSGDTYRWKSENVATKEVEIVMDSCPCVCEVNVYGVQVPGQEGAAGMAAVVLDKDWNCDDISCFVADNLPYYARPLFIRTMEELPKTSTLKHIKYGLKKEGFDPTAVKDPIYFWNRQEEKYIPLDEDLYADICGGNVKL